MKIDFFFRWKIFSSRSESCIGSSSLWLNKKWSVLISRVIQLACSDRVWKKEEFRCCFDISLWMYFTLCSNRVEKLISINWNFNLWWLVAVFLFLLHICITWIYLEAAPAPSFVICLNRQCNFYFFFFSTLNIRVFFYRREFLFKKSTNSSHIFKDSILIWCP